MDGGFEQRFLQIHKNGQQEHKKMLNIISETQTKTTVKHYFIPMMIAIILTSKIKSETIIELPLCTLNIKIWQTLEE